MNRQKQSGTSWAGLRSLLNPMLAVVLWLLSGYTAPAVAGSVKSTFDLAGTSALVKTGGIPLIRGLPFGELYSGSAQLLVNGVDVQAEQDPVNFPPNLPEQTDAGPGVGPATVSGLNLDGLQVFRVSSDPGRVSETFLVSIDFSLRQAGESTCTVVRLIAPDNAVFMCDVPVEIDYDNLEVDGVIRQVPPMTLTLPLQFVFDSSVAFTDVQASLDLSIEDVPEVFRGVIGIDLSIGARQTNRTYTGATLGDPEPGVCRDRGNSCPPGPLRRGRN